MNLSNLSHILLSLDCGFILILVAQLLGRRLAGFIKIGINSSLERFLLIQALGLAAVSYSVFLMGLGGGISKANFIYLYIIAIPLIFWADIKKIAEGIMRLLGRYRLSLFLGNKTFVFKIALILFLLFAGITFLNALTPPIEKDALNYHLMMARHYAETSKLGPIEANFYSYFPQFTEMLYTFGMVLSHDYSAHIIHFYFGILAALAIFSFVRRASNSETAMMCMLVFYSTPVVSQLSGWAYVDLALCFYAVCGVHYFIRALEAYDAGSFKLSALLLGISLGIKYIALYSVYVIPILFLACYARSDEPKRRFLLRQAAIFFAICAAVGSPWYLRSFFLTGNPVYPFFYSVFGGPNWDDTWAVLLDKFSKTYGMGRSLKDVALIPLRLAVYRNVNWPFDGHVGFAYLALFPLILFFRPKDRFFFYSMVYCASFSFIWFCQSQVARYLLPALGVLSICLWPVFSRSVRGKMINFGAITIISMLLIIYNSYYCIGLFRIFKPLSFISGKVERDDFLSAHLKYYNVMRYINTHLPSDSKVYLVYMGNIEYYCRRPFFEDIIFTDYTLRGLIDKAASPEDIMGPLREKGITHIAIDEEMAHRYLCPTTSETQLAIYDKFKKEHMRVIQRIGGVYLYSMV